MDPSQIHTSDKGPPLPCRCKMTPQIRRNRNQIDTSITSKSNDDAASDTDSGYEYVANPMKNRNRLAVDKFIDGQGQIQNEYHGNGKGLKSQLNKSNNADQTEASADPADCGKNFKLDFSIFVKATYTSHMSKKQQGVTETFHIHDDQQQTRRLASPRLHEDIVSSGDEGETEDTEGLEGRKDTQRCNQDLYNYMSYRKRLHFASDDNILYKMRLQQEICCPFKEDTSNDGYQKLIKETMEPQFRTHKYRKLNKLTMEPRLATTEPQCNVDHADCGKTGKSDSTLFDNPMTTSHAFIKVK